MPFRSVRSYSSTRLSSLALAAAFGLIAPMARATIDSHPYPPGRETGTNLFWYQVKGTPTSSTTNLQDPGYPAIDVTAGQAGGSDNDRITINFSSDKAVDNLPSGQAPFVYIILKGQNSGPETAVPIARVGDRDCRSSAGVCAYTTTEFENDNFSRAIPYTKGASVDIGLYVRDICTIYNRVNAATTNSYGVGCSSSTGTIDLSSGTGGSITLEIRLMAGDASTGAPIANPSTLDSATFVLNFRTESSTLTCPKTQAEFKDVYYPGDGQIEVNAETLFNLGNRSSASAPPTVVIVVAREGSVDPTSLASFKGEVPFRGRGNVGGFINSTGPGDHVYEVGFLMRDAAGLVAFDSTCKVSNVQASEIQGFLKKGSCFIATGAFRSFDAAPVAMLREFRDTVLLPSSAGRGFVRWYYSWSPSAAEWLMLHPGFRYPVLRALAPLEIFAIGMLRAPLLVALLALAGLAVCVFTVALSWLREARE